MLGERLINHWNENWSTASRKGAPGMISNPESLLLGSVVMQKVLALVSVAAVLATTLMPAYADGWRRQWRGHRYAVGVISRNVITPYYYPYYGSHYSYVAPDPIPPPTYVRYVFAPPPCWAGVLGYWVC